METFDFSQEVLDLASKISLADLLDSPLTQCWAVSCVTSSLGTAAFREDTLEEVDELIEVKLIKLARLLPYAEKAALFEQCKTLLDKRRLAKTAK